MLVKFGVENFRSVKDYIELSFEASSSDELEDYYVINAGKNLRLLKMAAIYGANASGKTNVLKALAFLRNLVLDPREKKTDTIDYDRFLFDDESKYLPIKKYFIA